MTNRRPVLRAHNETSVEGVFVVGDLAGAPVIKMALEQGEELAQHLHRLLAKPSTLDLDVVVIGAGAAGLSVALRLHRLGRKVLVIEKREVAATFADFPQGKRIYANPVEWENRSALDFEESGKDALVRRWREQAAGLELHEGESAIRLKPRLVVTDRAEYPCRYVVLASGVRGNPRRLEVDGENAPNVLHRLYNPGAFDGQRILVVGGGNSAAEAAVALSAANTVTLLHRGDALDRVPPATRAEMGKVKVKLASEVARFDGGSAQLKSGESLPFDHAFVLIGADVPSAFLKALGLRLENEWTWKRWLLLAAMLILTYTIYGVKYGKGEEFWPFTGWGYEALSFFGRGWSFWYTVLYTALVTVFGLQAMKRWGLDPKDRFQIWRFATLIGFQWTFFFLIPEFLFQWAVKYQWVGESLARDPNFAGNAWRSYGLVYAWPLFFYTFFGNPHQVWIVWGVVVSFVILPILVLLHGKRYCSWICGCGGLAETLGDRWRHLSPKGSSAIAWEKMNAVVLAIAVIVTVLVLGQDLVRAFREPAGATIKWYRLVVDTWLVGILPVALYPFFGGKVWCRYWCPLAKLMEIWSGFYTRMRWSRFAIVANEKCIACGECTRNCQVGIDVMHFALNRKELNNANSSCIGCGICITVCPMDVLTFGSPVNNSALIQIAPASH